MKEMSPVVMAELSKVSVRVNDDSPVVPMRVMTDGCSMVPSDGEHQGQARMRRCVLTPILMGMRNAPMGVLVVTPVEVSFIDGIES